MRKWWLRGVKNISQGQQPGIIINQDNYRVPAAQTWGPAASVLGCFSLKWSSWAGRNRSWKIQPGTEQVLVKGSLTDWMIEWVNLKICICLKDHLPHPDHAEAYNSVLFTYHCCQQPFPPRYPEASLMALTIPASQDTIKSFSPASVPPPLILAPGPGLGE